MAKLNQLPDLCLVAIFNRVPLNDLPTIGLVSYRWKSLLPQVANKITSLTISIGFDPFHGITTLFVFPSNDSLENNDKDENRTINDMKYHSKMYTNMNSLILENNFSLSMAQQIAKTFANVTSLEVTFAQMSNESVSSVVHLLNHYHSKLISIKLFCAHDQLMKHGNPYFDCSPLLSSINQMPSPLRCLLIELTDKTTIKTTTLPIISQLEQFYFYNSNYNGDQYKSMVNYIEQNPNLRQFGLDYISLEAILEFKIENRVTQLINSSDPTIYLEIHDLFYLCDRFTSLTNVAAEAGTNIFYTIFGPLSRLQNLTNLQLRVTFGVPKYSLKALGLLARRPVVQEQLASVQTVEFELKDLKKASDFIDLDISYRFPSVQAIKLIFQGVEPNYVEKNKVYDHLKSMCSSLHHLFVEHEVIWNAERVWFVDCAQLYNHRMIEL